MSMTNMSHDEAALEARQLAKAYAQGFLQKNRRVVLGNVSLQVPKNKIAAIVGPNAVGKTTFLRIAAGLLDPDKGVVLIGNKRPQDSRIAMLRRTISSSPGEKSSTTLACRLRSKVCHGGNGISV